MTSVVVPVGPSEANHRWLREAIDSVAAQIRLPDELLIVDDSNDVENKHPYISPRFDDLRWEYRRLPFKLHIWVPPWRMGVAHAFNCGVALAQGELVFMLGSDDTLYPECLEACYDEYIRCNDPIAYYFVGVRYMDTGETQTVPCHAAMVTKSLWRHTGGFPLESASGAPDAALLSIMFGRGPVAGRIRPVADAKPLYNYRRHGESDTAGKADWQRVILETRDLVTREWQPR